MKHIDMQFDKTLKKLVDSKDFGALCAAADLDSALDYEDNSNDQLDTGIDFAVRAARDGHDIYSMFIDPDDYDSTTLYFVAKSREELVKRLGKVKDRKP